VAGMSKTCNRCKINKPLSLFGNDSGGKKLRSWCKECDSIVAKERKLIRENAPAIPDNHICPVCGKNESQLNETQQPTMRKRGSPWVCDHDHDAKTFRGWICRKCNLGLGNFSDDYDLVLKAAKYLKEYNDGK
jgi:hypothetical protein